MRVVMIVAGLALIASSALAAPKVKAPVGEKQADIWAIVQKGNLADVKYAALLAKQANTPRSNIRGACYQAWAKALEQKDKFGLLNLDGSPSSAKRPEQANLTNFEERMQAADHLDPVGYLMAACQPAASLSKMSVERFFTSFVAGK